MKIIRDGSVFIQKGDMAVLSASDMPIPASIFMKFFDQDVVINDGKNRYEFVEFNDESEIDFFKGLDWLIDYDEVKNLSGDDIQQLMYTTNTQRNVIAEKFNSMTPEEKENNQGMVNKCNLLLYKIDSLRDFYWFKQGYIKMQLPDGIDYPEGYVKEKGIRRVLGRFFNNKHKKNNLND